MSSAILTLPLELLKLVLDHSDYVSGLALRYTCKSLYSQTSTAIMLGSARAQHPNTTYDMSDLLQVEKWPCYDRAGGSEAHMKQPIATRDFFACSLCLKIRCASKFSNAMMKGKRGKHSAAASADKDERRKRFCIDCGVHDDKYLPGVSFDFGGVQISDMGNEFGGGRGLVCQRCGQFQRVRDVLGPPERICRACLVARRS